MAIPDLEGQRPDAQAQEPQLPTSEVREPVLRLIGDFKAAIKNTSEFQGALQGLHLTEAQRADIWNPDNPFSGEIEFNKGEYIYNVKYVTRSGEDLHVRRDPRRRDRGTRADLSYESVWLWAPAPNQEGKNLIGGMIMHTECIDDFFKGLKTTRSTNKLSTIEKAKGFLSTNFSQNQETESRDQQPKPLQRTTRRRRK